MNPPNKSPIPTKLVPVSEVARQLGYRDARNFRRAVAPRIGLTIIRVGLRWFSTEEELNRVMRSLTHSQEVHA